MYVKKFFEIRAYLKQLKAHYTLNETNSITFDAFVFHRYKVAVHSPWELPTRSDHHFLKLPPSHSLYISVTPELISYQPSECQGHSQVFSSYQQSNCFLECRSRCSTSLCGCVPLFQPSKYKSSYKPEKAFHNKN